MDLPRLFREPFRRHPPNFRAHLRTWLDSPAGARLMAAETALLDDITPAIFGFHAAQICTARPVSMLSASRIPHRVLVATDEAATAGAEPVQLLAATGQLPFGNDSLDLVLLHHTLDFDDDPHAALREAARVIVPGGALVVVGCNPWSLFGFLRLFHWGALDAPWFARCIGAQRVGDWLRLLDFRIDGVESAYYLPPLQGTASARRLGWLQTLGQRLWPRAGMFYVLVARKSVAAMMPVRRFDRQQRPLTIGVPVAGRIGTGGTTPRHLPRNES
ncbi:MAG: class I SAM-dependent methyltransferase [Pseudomonadota bacterium]